MHSVAVVALEGVIGFDLAIPCEVFGRARLPSGTAAYGLKVCGLAREVQARAYGVVPRYGLAELGHADTIIVPGIEDIAAPLEPKLLRALKSAAAGGARVASICTGAFVLAAAGLLDGLRVTTHWLAAEELARRYPRVEVDAEVLYVDHGHILTSAGAAAGIDLCLHLVRTDYGSAVAADSARKAVTPLERSGGQSQFIVHAPPTAESGSLQPLLVWLEQQLHQPHTLSQLARRAGLSVRTLNRRFREQTGTTPLKWLLRARVRRAQHLLETSDHSVEVIAGRVGFGSASACREHFQHFVSTTPQAYRRTFRSVATSVRA